MEDSGDVQRAYRAVMEPEGLTCYGVKIGESDLYVCTRGDARAAALVSLRRHRGELEAYLASHSGFGTSFKPVPAAGEAPGIVADMAAAGMEMPMSIGRIVNSTVLTVESLLTKVGPPWLEVMLTGLKFVLNLVRRPKPAEPTKAASHE